MTRYGVSAEFVRPGRVGGLEQALGYMIDGMASQLEPIDSLTIIGHASERLPRSNVRSISAPRQASNRFVQETRTLRRVGPTVDSYFLPNYFTPPGRRRCRVVTMIPDLQYRHHPENFSPQKRLWQRWAHGSTLRRADAVVVFSDFVRLDILDRHGGRAADKVVTTPLPVSWSRFGHGTGEVRHDRPYVLTVASHYRHKNLATLLRAFTRVRQEMPDLELVMVGQTGSALVGVRQAEDVAALVHSAGLDGHVSVTGYIDDSTLGDWYRGAELFVFPSIFEGFGLPPVEALGFGLPVLTTRCASLPEVTRGLARHIDDPFDDEEMAAMIVEIVEAGERPSADAVSQFRAYYSPAMRGAALLDVLRGDR